MPAITTKSKTENSESITKDNVQKYISQLSAQEKLVLQIASSHLETSFDITKSIGYIEWLQKN